MKSLFNTEAYKEIENRINSLSPQSSAQWGKMNTEQMLVHCQMPIEIAMGKRKPSDKPGILKKLLFSVFKSTLYNDKPWKQNLPTAKDFIITEEKDLQKERENLLALVNEFHTLKDKTQWEPHPFFGKLTPEQWGKSQYKHLDHHLKQFGV